MQLTRIKIHFSVSFARGRCGYFPPFFLLTGMGILTMVQAAILGYQLEVYTEDGGLAQ